MQFAILGPLDVSAGGQRLAVGGPQQRALLAALLLNAGSVVSTDRLVECLWGEEPPPAARSLLQGCVAGLRRALRSGSDPDRRPLVTRSPGYVLQVRPGELDLDRFERLVAAASRSAADPSRVAWEESADLLGRALSLWRGPALDGVPLEGCQAELARLDERRLTVLEQRIDADLRVGRHADLVGELEALVRAHPLRERLWAQLMVALYRADRQADALAAYQRLRRTLVDQLGVEPSARLRNLQGAILSGTDPGKVNPSDGDAKPGPDTAPTRLQMVAVTTPAQLPAAVAAFAGRHRELGQLDDLLADDATTAKAVVVSAVSGTAGIGKTALAVHWAHQVAERFPDGQLYANLRGFDPGRPPMEPADAVRGFLDALGVPAQRIPAALDAQTALYRSVLAGKRVLVVLDNARDSEQVRPLLPGAPGCLAIVTSRNHLTPLVATEGARLVPLDLLTDGDARELLTRRLGAARTAAEPDAVTEIVARCARLPLALAIAAARAASDPRLRLAGLAAQLRNAAGALDALHAGDPATDVRAVFSWSYHALTADGARLFRLLGLHPGPDLTAAAAASLAGVPPRRARILLAELVFAHLLTEHTPGRYAFHDLLRAYASEQAHRHDSDDDRRTAAHRVLDHYLHTAQAAARLRYRRWDHLTLDAAQVGVTPEEPPDEARAIAWLDAEHRSLLAAIGHAAALGFEGHAWRLAWTAMSYLQQRCQWRDLAATQRIALDAAQRCDDPAGQAHAHHGLGYAYALLGRHDEAGTHLRESLDRFRELGDQAGQARAHLNIDMILDRQGAHTEALSHGEQALILFRSAGHRTGEATALNSIGWLHSQLGRPRRALVVCQQALALQQETGDRDGQAAAWDSLGYAHHRLADHNQAVACYTRAADLCRDLGDRHNEADTLIRLGDTHQAAGDHDAARLTRQQALRILDEVDHPDAGQIRAKLDADLPAA